MTKKRKVLHSAMSHFLHGNLLVKPILITTKSLPPEEKCCKLGYWLANMTLIIILFINYFIQVGGTRGERHNTVVFKQKF